MTTEKRAPQMGEVMYWCQGVGCFGTIIVPSGTPLADAAKVPSPAWSIIGGKLWCPEHTSAGQTFAEKGCDVCPMDWHTHSSNCPRMLSERSRAHGRPVGLLLSTPPQWFVESLGDARRGRLLQLVARERQRQDRKHGFDPTRPDGTGGEEARARAAHLRAEYDAAVREGRVTFRAALEEEVGEALAETEPLPLARELLQVSAMAVKWVEIILARGRLGIGELEASYDPELATASLYPPDAVTRGRQRAPSQTPQETPVDELADLRHRVWLAQHNLGTVTAREEETVRALTDAGVPAGVPVGKGMTSHFPADRVRWLAARRAEDAAALTEQNATLGAQVAEYESTLQRISEAAGVAFPVDADGLLAAVKRLAGERQAHDGQPGSLARSQLVSMADLVPLLRSTQDAAKGGQVPKRRSCNRHDDCDAAQEAARLAGKPERFGPGSTRIECCNDDDCDDCLPK